MTDEPKYPNVPGHKGEHETGRDAAAAIAPKLGRLQKLVADLVERRGPVGMTPEEAAEVSGLDRVSVQPRFSELKAKGVIAASPMRRANPSSRKKAVVWVAAKFAPPPPEAPEGSAA